MPEEKTTPRTPLPAPGGNGQELQTPPLQAEALQAPVPKAQRLGSGPRPKEEVRAESGSRGDRPSAPDASERTSTQAFDIGFLSLEPPKRDAQTARPVAPVDAVAPVAPVTPVAPVARATPKAPDIVELDTPAPDETGPLRDVPVVDGDCEPSGEQPAADATNERMPCSKPSDTPPFDANESETKPSETKPSDTQQSDTQQSDKQQSDKQPSARWDKSPSVPARAEKNVPGKPDPCDGARPTGPKAANSEANDTSKDVAAALSVADQELAPDGLACEGDAHDADAPGTGRRGRARKIVVLKSFAIVFLSLLVLLLLSLLVVQFNVERLTSFALEELSRKTGVKIEFSGASMRFFPVPAIGVNRVRVVVPQEKLGLPEGNWPDLDFRAHAIYFAPSILALLNGEFEPELIVLDAPAFVGTLPVAFHELFGASDKENYKTNGKENDGEQDENQDEKQDEKQTDDQEKEWLNALNGLKNVIPYHSVLKVYNGGISLRDIEGAHVRTDNLTLDLSFTNLPLKNPLNGIRGTLAVDRACVQTKDFAAQGADLSLSGKTSLTAPLQDLACEVEGRLAITPLNFAVAARLKLHGDRTTILGGEGRLKGFFVFDGTEIPYDIEASISSTADAGDHLALAPRERTTEPFTRLTVRTFALGDDVLAIDAIVFPDLANPGAAGRLSIEKLSLTRWLAFARDLSPGLQNSLDRITDGYIDFYIDTNHLVAPDILATAANATFAGKGGIADWKAIEVFLDMESDFVDLGVGIAESVGVKVAPPTYGHRPLTDMRMVDIFPPAKSASMDEASQSAGAGQNDGKVQAAATAAKRTTGAGAGSNAPSTHHAPGAGESGTPAPSLSYDIRLMSHNIHYGYIDLTEGGVVIHPGKNSKGVPSAQIDMRTRLHGGTLTGYGHFTDENLDEKTEYEFHVEGKGVNLEALHTQLAFVPIVQGTGECVVDVTSEGSEIDDFLANLRGRVRAISTHTRLLDDHLFSPLRADVTLELQNAAFTQSALGLNGSWSVVCEGNAGWQASFRLPGQIWFGGEGDKAGVHFTQLDLQLEAKRLEKLFKALGAKDVNARLRGRATLDTSQKSVRAEGADITLPGLRARGTAAFAMKGSTPTVTGTLSEAILDVPQASRTVTGKAADIPKEFSTLTLTETGFSARDGFLGISKFKSKVDGIALSGSLNCDFSAAVPKLTMDVRVGALDLDARQPKEKDDGKKDKNGKKGKTDKGDKAGAGKPLDYSFMKKVDADGTLRLDRLRAKKIAINDVRAPFSLKGGKLSLPDVRGKIYGGAFTASGTCDFTDGLAFSLKTKVNAFDLGELMRDRGSKDIYTAKVDFTAKLASTMKREGELARNLNGQVAFAAGKGSFQGVTEKGKKESPIQFNEGGCTAEITNGVLRTKDFRIKGDSLRLTGSGWIDLGKEELDLQLEADMSNLPNIPMRIHGSFDNPKRDISGGMVILNALGGLARGAFNVVGSVFSALFGIFR